jgi:dethiobiotin synthetase
MTVILVTGTGTEVGKTYVTAALARVLRAQGHAVVARKPVQSFAPGEAYTDALVLAAATGEDPHTVCPEHRWLPVPVAPPMAVDMLGLEPFTVHDLIDEMNVPPEGITLVESVGGILSPIAIDGDTCDLVIALSPALVVVVADAGLGTINVVRLTIAALGDTSAVVYLNRYDETDELHTRNADWLRTREGLEIVTDPEALSARVLATS